MAGQSLAAFRRRLEDAARSIAGFGPAIEAGRPWPLGRVEPGGSEDAWGPPEILAHVAEMLPYWLGEMERVLDGSAAGAGADAVGAKVTGAGTDAAGAGTGVETPAPAFGRTETDTLRIMRIEQERTLPPRELLARIESEAGRWDARLASLRDDDLARVGTHPRRGEMTLRDVCERFVVGHLEDHLEQLRRALGSTGSLS